MGVTLSYITIDNIKYEYILRMLYDHFIYLNKINITHPYVVLLINFVKVKFIHFSKNIIWSRGY